MLHKTIKVRKYSLLIQTAQLNNICFDSRFALNNRIVIIPIFIGSVFMEQYFYLSYHFASFFFPGSNHRHLWIIHTCTYTRLPVPYPETLYISCIWGFGHEHIKYWRFSEIVPSTVLNGPFLYFLCIKLVEMSRVILDFDSILS